MVASLRPSPKLLGEVSDARTCDHCGGRLFLDTDPRDLYNPNFLNCTNCARHFRMDGTPIRQSAMTVTPPRRNPRRSYRTRRSNWGSLVRTH